MWSFIWPISTIMLAIITIKPIQNETRMDSSVQCAFPVRNKMSLLLLDYLPDLDIQFEIYDSDI